MNHLVWVGTRIVIRDHAGTSSDAATLRRAIDVARQRAATSLGDVVRIDHRQSVDAFNSPAIDLTALRYETLINLVTGKHAQQFLTEMCWDGSAPTRKQLEAKLDKMIEEAR
ncbi:hypothetical protein ACIPF8_19130 [Collimonas sp. NPDC087041]|uniref:hypothetical protein n=1 Tax=Collimonas sp. NPDC087041 TaxID=3363960 RepID=UPI003806D23D